MSIDPSAKLCECGCGQLAPISPYTNRNFGYVRGEPHRFVHGHGGRNRDRRGLLGAAYFNIEDRGFATPCWIWKRALNHRGYGVSYSNPRKRQWPAHRVVYEQRIGAIPEGLVAHHVCRNRACVNPAHIELVTPVENSRARLDTKLNDDQRREIVRLRAEGVSKNRLGRLFDVETRVIDNVLASPPRPLEPA